MNAQVKSRERVAAHGEVFTAEREVNAMCDLVAEQCATPGATFLEPACGEGNFLAEILTRKLNAIKSNYERNSLVALSSLYGVDILQDNITACRQRLFSIWDNHSHHSQAARTRAREILNNNIICADALAPETINFFEWQFDDASITPKKKSFNLGEELTQQIAFSF